MKPPPAKGRAASVQGSRKRKAADDGRGGSAKKSPTLNRRGKRRAQTVDTDTTEIDFSVDNVDNQDYEDPEEAGDWCTYINTFDVCITTYNILQQDLNVARPPPTRPRRSNVEYNREARARSPLIMCEWHRVIMDEVQMVGGGKAA